MPIKINPAPRFTVDVALSIPGQDPAAVKVSFRHKTAQQYADWARPLEGRTDAAWLAEVIEDLGPILDDQDQVVPYSPAQLAVLLSHYPSAAAELARAYGRALWEGRRGN